MQNDKTAMVDDFAGIRQRMDEIAIEDQTAALEGLIWEEGGACPLCPAGHLAIAYPVGCCTSFLSAPCWRCTPSFLECNYCGERSNGGDG